jgi:hypothetical protein
MQNPDDNQRGRASKATRSSVMNESEQRGSAFQGAPLRNVDTKVEREAKIRKKQQELFDTMAWLGAS